MKCFTLFSGTAIKGFSVEALKNGDKIFGVSVEKESEEKFISVKTLKKPNLGYTVMNVILGYTKNGAPKLFEVDQTKDRDQDQVALIVTRIGESNVLRGDYSEGKKHFQAFPGNIICSGKQQIATIPKGKVFRTGYFGSNVHFYMWKGGDDFLVGMTTLERKVSDLW